MYLYEQSNYPNTLVFIIFLYYSLSCCIVVYIYFKSLETRDHVKLVDEVSNEVMVTEK